MGQNIIPSSRSGEVYGSSCASTLSEEAGLRIGNHGVLSEASRDRGDGSHAGSCSRRSVDDGHDASEYDGRMGILDPRWCRSDEREELCKL